MCEYILSVVGYVSFVLIMALFGLLHYIIIIIMQGYPRAMNTNDEWATVVSESYLI